MEPLYKACAVALGLLLCWLVRAAFIWWAQRSPPTGDDESDGVW